MVGLEASVKMEEEVQVLGLLDPAVHGHIYRATARSDGDALTRTDYLELVRSA